MQTLEGLCLTWLAANPTKIRFDLLPTTLIPLLVDAMIQKRVCTYLTIYNNTACMPMRIITTDILRKLAILYDHDHGILYKRQISLNGTKGVIYGVKYGHSGAKVTYEKVMSVDKSSSYESFLLSRYTDYVLNGVFTAGWYYGRGYHVKAALMRIFYSEFIRNRDYYTVYAEDSIGEKILQYCHLYPEFVSKRIYLPEEILSSMCGHDSYDD